MPVRYWMLVAALGGCLIIPTLIVLHLPGSERSQRPEEQHEHTGQPEKHDPQQTNDIGSAGVPAPTSIVASKSEGRSPEDQGRIEPRYLTPEDSIAQWIMAIASVAATVISIWAVCLLRDTLKATRTTIRVAARSNRIASRANDVASEATTAALKSTEVTERTAKQQLRAYVMPISIGFVDKEDCSLAIDLEFKNTGQTPAKRPRHIVKCSISEPHRKDFPVTSNEMKTYPDIGPGQNQTGKILQPRRNSFVERGDDIVNGRVVLFVWGRIEYEDIFGRSQSTDFRFAYSPLQDDFVDCGEGNTAT